MYLKNKLKEIKNEDLNELIIQLVSSYEKFNGKNIQSLHNQGIIKNNSLEKELENAIFNQARKDFDFISSERLVPKFYMSQISSPACFVYSLEKNQFSNEEIKKIPFNNGENIELYKKKYNKGNLPKILFEKIISS